MMDTDDRESKGRPGMDHWISQERGSCCSVNKWRQEYEKRAGGRGERRLLQEEKAV